MKQIHCLVAVLVGFTSDLALQAQQKEPPKEITNSIGMKFVWIPPGSFMLGSPKEEEGRHPQHKVTLTKGFYLGICLVTQEQWLAIMSNNPSRFKGEKNLPVERVTWQDCQAFLTKLGKKEGHAYRLPTEAEWEYSCRAGSKSAYFFGDDQTLLGQFALIEYGSQAKAHPVGQEKPNIWGLYDMDGNVWEWCQDWYGDYPQKEVVDPQGPDTGQYRVLRNGSFVHYASDVRSGYRADIRTCFPIEIDSNRGRGVNIGFRVARTFTP